MIIANKSDKMVRELTESINGMKLFSGVKGLRTLHLYGISQSRSVDVMIPNGFPNGAYLTHVISNETGLRVMRGTLWTLAETYNNKVLGLGFNVRKNNPELCKRIVMVHYLSLNSMLKIPEKFATDLDLTQGEF